MAAVKCIATAGEGEASSIITALGGNGVEVGLKLGGRSGPLVCCCRRAAFRCLLAGYREDDRLGAIGDSALVDALGFGAMTSVSLPGEAGDGPTAAADLLPLQHPAFSRSRIHVGMPARNIRRAWRCARHRPWHSRSQRQRRAHRRRGLSSAVRAFCCCNCDT